MEDLNGFDLNQFFKQYPGAFRTRVASDALFAIGFALQNPEAWMVVCAIPVALMLRVKGWFDFSATGGRGNFTDVFVFAMIFWPFALAFQLVTWHAHYAR